MADKKVSLILIDKNKLWLYSGATGEILNLDFPTTVMKDMEVLNRDLLIKQFESFLSVHKVDGPRVDIVIAPSLLFIKDFSGIEEPKKEEAIKSFVDNVPFDSTAKTTMHMDKVVRVIVANKDLIILIKHSLEKRKCEVPLILPATVITNVSISSALDPQIAKAVLGQTDSLKAYNLLDTGPAINPLKNITANAADKSHPKRLPLLLSMFGGLISVLIGVAVVTNRQPTIPASQASVVLNPFPSLAKPTIVASPSAIISTLRIDLMRTDQAASKSSQLRTSLKNLGITDLKELVDNTIVLESSQLVFSQAIPVVVQEQIINIVKTVEPVFSTKVVTGLSRDVEIRLK
ncbi:MAG: hypothetical protein WAT72_04565 [Microgenomates group bacterium]|jgi:hypothetical protein|nr:hypothetical protein [Candidatus Woesebacteria bacterium]MBP6883205.1 hypothetical protein [Candidatus Woesebacteria bacterium]QQR63940.1 MAG: hypothetical protein IPH70_00150 [Candidatus Roizmanbacteria bacterium]